MTASSFEKALPARATRQLPRPARAIVVGLAAGLPALMVAAIPLLPLLDQRDGWALFAYPVVVATWAAMGAVIVLRRPGNLVGWLLWVVGVGLAVSLVGQSWSYISATRAGGTLPGTVAGAWLSWLFTPMLALALTVPPLLFPDGRLLSRRWLLVLVIAVGAAVGLALGTIVKPGQLDFAALSIANPTGIPELDGVARELLNLSGVVLLPCLVLAALAAALRFRHGTPIERQQLKWFGSAMGLAALGLAGAATLPQPIGIACYIGMTIALGFVPVAIGIAILRYRLYDIDRLIGRTLAYTAVTALLATAFVGTNLALQGLLSGVTGGETLTTALATLVVAGLFQPLRRRVQAPIDRRFNRARVDGQRVLQAFAHQARDEVDLETLRMTLARALDDAVAPSRAGIWLRPNR
jgi:hypothetical protein